MIISDQKQFQNLRLQEEESNELNDVVDKVWTLHKYWASNSSAGTTEDGNVLAHWATGFQFLPALLMWPIMFFAIINYGSNFKV